jgi:hypothetical protein
LAGSLNVAMVTIKSPSYAAAHRPDQTSNRR